ncbi:MAG TPA: glycosyltransferase family 39 protein [Vicinamibacterales bacterium]|nr:glycosyltransferase family 39 protein [Vicinamibacterales bacterium]
MKNPRTGRWLALIVIAAAGLEALYWWGGHPFVTRAYARGGGNILFNLIPAPGMPLRPLQEYLDRADAVWRTFQLAWMLVAAVLVAAPALDRATGRLHARCLRFGRACAERPRAFLIGGAVVVALVTATVGWLVLEHFPNSGDEYCYLYQADTLLAGRLSNTPHPLQPFFETSHIIERGGRLFSVFPPGWPLMLAAGMRVGLPPWTLNPLLSAAMFVLVFWLARRVTGDDATAALASVMLATTNYFLLTGASYFSHTACATLVAGAMIAMLRMAEGRAWSAAAAGLLAGLAVITRYYTPVLCLLPLTIVLLRERPWRTEYLWAIAGALPPIVFMLVYNHTLSGNALVLSKGGVEQYDELWFATGFWRRGAEFMGAHLFDLMLWTPPALFIAYLAGVRRAAPFKSRLGAVGAGFACLVLGLYPYMNRGGNQYGPRFYFDGFPLLVIVAAAAVFGATRYEDRSRASRRLVYLYFASVVAHVAIAAMQLQATHAQVDERLDLTRRVAASSISRALVFVETPIGLERAMFPDDFTRNGIDFSPPVLYALDRGASNQQLRDYYPDRECYRYRFDVDTRTGSLMPCAPR